MYSTADDWFLKKTKITLHVMPYGAWDTRGFLPWLRTPPAPPSPNGLWPFTEASPALQPLMKCLPTPQASRMKAPPPEP